jgi:hypothetical protein
MSWEKISRGEREREEFEGKLVDQMLNRVSEYPMKEISPQGRCGPHTLKFGENWNQLLNFYLFASVLAHRLDRGSPGACVGPFLRVRSHGYNS